MFLPFFLLPFSHSLDLPPDLAHEPPLSFPSTLDSRPPRPSGPSIPLQYTAELPSFNIRGLDGNYSVRTAWTAYAANLQIGNSFGLITSGTPAELFGVTFSIHPQQISANAIVLAFKLRNDNSTDYIGHVAVEVDIMFDEHDNAPVWGLPGERGFIVYSPNYTLAWALSDYPLVTNVTTYWFGLYGNLAYNLYSQVDVEDFNDTDSSMAFSWQNVTLPAGSTIVLSVLAKFGNFESDILMFDLNLSNVPQPTLYYQTVVTLQGTVHGKYPGPVSLFLILDNDFTNFIPVNISASVHIEFTFSFTAVDFLIRPGPREFRFYAIDSDGNVAQSANVTTIILAPTPTVSHSPTGSRSPSPHPTQTPAPANVDIEVDLLSGSFNISGHPVNDTAIRTSFYGYQAILNVNDTIVAIDRGSPATVWDVELSFNFATISDNAALLVFELYNEGSVTQIANVAVSSDIYFDGNDGAPVTEIVPFSGFVISSDKNALSFILRNSSLVTDVSTFWYGYAGFRSLSLFTQTTANSINEIDSGLALSWQGISLSPGERTARSFIARFGVYERKVLGLSLAFPSVPNGTIGVKLTITIPGRVESSDPTDSVSFLVIVDNSSNVFTLTALGRYSVNTNIEVPFRAADYGVSGGHHVFAFYAIDRVGNPSPPQLFAVNVLAETATPRASIAVTQTPSPSASPRINLPIAITNDTYAGFNILGLLGDEIILSTLWGYTVRLQIGASDVAMVSAVPVSLDGVELAVSWRYISSNAAIIYLEASNQNTSAQLIDIAIATDINFEGNDRAPCYAIPGRRGFSIRSPANVLTFITGGYPLVTNVSTFWFGWYYNATLEGWTQVTADAFEDQDSALALTWQNVSLRPGESVTKSIIVKFGLFESSRIELALSWQPAGPVYCHDTLAIGAAVTAVGVPTVLAVRIFFAVDGELAGLTEIEGAFVINSDVVVPFVPAEYGLMDGNYTVTFYAVDGDGSVSIGQSVRLEVTHTPLRTATASATATGSRSVGSRSVGSRSVVPTSSFLRRTATAESETQEPESSGSTEIIVAAGVIGGLSLVIVIACIIRSKRRRWFHKVDEKLDDGSEVPTEEPSGLATEGLMAS